MEYNHEIQMPVRFTDIDLLGHVSNSSYSSLLDDGRVGYFRTVGGVEFEWHNISFVLVNINLDFVRPAFLFENLRIRTRTVQIGTKSLRMEQEIIRIEDNEVVCRSHSTLVGFNLSTQTSNHVTDFWIERLETFEQRNLRTPSV